MIHQIKYNVDDNLYMKYLNNATNMWLADKWIPMKHLDYTEAAYDIIIQKLVCEQLVETSREAGDKMMYTKSLLMRDAIDHVEDRFINKLSQRDRSAYLMLTVNLNNHHSRKCKMLSMENVVLTSN